MAFTAATRPMEDFFLNDFFQRPTLDNISDSRRALPSPMPDNTLYHVSEERSSRIPQVDRSSKMAALQPPSASITHPAQELDYFCGYVSDEETASPMDNDDLSFLSPEINQGATSATSALSSPPGQLIETAQVVEQHCSRAQAVRIQPAGKPRVIDLPKLDLSYRRTSRPPPDSLESRRASLLRRSTENLRSTRSSQDSYSRHDSMDSSSSSGTSPASTAPSSVGDDEKRFSKDFGSSKQQSSQPVRTSSLSSYATATPTTPATSKTFDHIRRRSTDLSDRLSMTPSSPTGSLRPSIRKMGMFTSRFGLGGAKEPKSAAKAHREDLEIVRESYSDYTAPQRQVPQLQSPTANRRASVQPKLIARGANERAPTIVLPPFPGD